jgi:hypothetical protein
LLSYGAMRQTNYQAARIRADARVNSRTNPGSPGTALGGSILVGRVVRDAEGCAGRDEAGDHRSGFK